MRVSKGLEVSISLTMLGVATLLIIGSFVYLKSKGEQKIKAMYESSTTESKDIPLQNNNNVKVNVYKDWAEDSTMTQGKIETLNEIFAR